MLRSSLLALLLTGCLGQADSDDPENPTGTETDTDVGPPCEATVALFDPENGATEVDPGALIQVGFTAPVTAEQPWSIEVIGPGGSEVAGTATLGEGGTFAQFDPDVPLLGETTYQLLGSVCDDEALSAFTTAFAIDPALIEGRTYAVSYPTIDFATPSIANTLSPADWITIQIDTVDPANAALTAIAGLANGSPPVPDCVNTLDAGVADFSTNPLMTVGPTDFVLPVDTDLITIEDFEMRGRFAPGAGALENVRIRGNLDTRGITIINNVCALSALSGAPCGPCRDGVNQCLEIEATAEQADYYADLDLATECGL
jgi:hypothetical protein